MPKISGKYLSNLVLSFEKKSEKFTQKVPKKLAQIRGEGCAIDAYKATHSKFGKNFSLYSSFYEGGTGAPLTPIRPHTPKFERAIDAYKATKAKNRRKTRHWLPIRPHTLKSEWPYRKPSL